MMRILLRGALSVAMLAVFSARTANAETALARYSFTAGWATFGLALPQGAAADGVQIGSLPTQTDVKVRWPDGSIRFAVVSSKIPYAGSFAIQRSSSGVGALTAGVPPVSVTLTIGGRPYVAQLPSGRSDFWLQGPLVSESRAVVAPGDHPFLRVIFDVRSFAGGGHRVDVAVENCLDVASADEITYEASIAIGGQTVFRQANVAHKYLARWRRVFFTGATESYVTFDTAPFVAARALPAYLSTIAATPRALTGGGVSGTGFGILGFGDLTVPMNAHSGRPELAPYPDWTARFLVHKTAPHRDYVLRHGELAGSWGIHVRNPDGSMPSIDARGNGYYWLDPRWKDNGFTGPQGHLEHRAEPGDIAHQPSLAFVPYLLTGDRFFADEVAFWANFCLIGSFSSDDNRKGAQGLLIGNEVRGIGWGLRNLGDAAAYLPDASPMKAYLASKVVNNLTYLDQYATSFYSGRLETLFPRRRPEDGKPPYDKFMWISLWEQSYVAWAIDRVMQHGQVTPAYNFASAGATMRNRIARLQLNLFTHPQWPRERDREAPYLVAAGWWAPDRRIIYFQTFADMAAATFSVPTPANPDFVRPFEGYYGPEARLLLFICDGLGDATAPEAIARLMADETDHVTMADDLNARSGWAIARESVNPAARGATTALPQRPASQGARR
ncbi:MAG: hypothetical protein DMF93_16805 [Acidobacteria bacterium]|nr:MAG: hypothetical protein DMF93_16805 [Acidobacteriota bacterium]